MSNDPRPLQRKAPGARVLLSRILSAPDLPAQIERLPPPVLGKLIDRVGLEDAGEIVALATTEQLAQLFDDDLWKNERPGEEERFDPERFLLWLEVMLEAGEDFVAKKLSELPEDLVTLALHRHVLVIDIEALAQDMDESDDAYWDLEKALEATLHEEIGEYRLIARRHDGWDTLLTAVLALDKEHHDVLWRILERCCHMSARYIEENDGLYEVLTSDEMLEADVAGDREDRRAEKGHVAPAAAKSFLALARIEPSDAKDARDPVTKAYFRELDRTPSAPAAAPKSPAKDVLRTLPRILAEEGVTDEAPAPWLLPGGPGAAEDPLLIQAMRAIGEDDPRLFEARTEELAYLANVLVAGCSFRDRRFRPIEALRAAIATASLGLALSLPPGDRLSAATSTLRALPVDNLFRKGYRRLVDDVAMRAARASVALLDRASSGADHPDRPHLAKAAAALRAALAEGKPWTALSRLDALTGTLPPPALEALRALQDELPTRPPVLEQTPSSRPDDEPARFFTTPDDITSAHRFLLALAASPSPSPAAPPPPSPAPPKKPVDKKPVGKKPIARKPVGKKPIARKPVAKKPVAKKPVAKKPVARKKP